MGESGNRGLVVALVAVVGLVVFFGGGAISGRSPGVGWETVRAWMWIPAGLALVFVGLLLVSLLGKRE